MKSERWVDVAASDITIMYLKYKYKYKNKINFKIYENDLFLYSRNKQ